jgi:hypothetical protein
MLPWWAPSLQARLASLAASADQPAGSLALLEPGWVTHVQWRGEEGAAPAVQAIWVEAADEGMQAQDEFQASVGADSLAGADVGALRFSIRSADSWADELDLAGPRGRTAPVAWLTLLAGLCALAAVLPMAADAQAERQAAQEAVKRLQRATHQLTLRSLPSPRSGAGQAGGGGLSAEQQGGAARLARTLAYPWMSVLSQTEAAAASQNVAMLSFSADLASTGARQKPARDAASLADVRLSAAVISDEQALRWAQAHGPRAQLLSRARLPSSLATPDGTYAWRAEAIWKAGVR